MTSKLADSAQDSQKKKIVPKRYERLNVDLGLLSRVDAWCSQADEQFQGKATVSRSDVMSVVVSDHDERLSSTELNKLWERCFDAIQFMKAATKRFGEAKAKGENITLEDMVRSLKPAMAEARPRRAQSNTRRSKSVDQKAITSSAPHSTSVE